MFAYAARSFSFFLSLTLFTLFLSYLLDYIRKAIKEYKNLIFCLQFNSAAYFYTLSSLQFVYNSFRGKDVDIYLAA